MDKLEIVVLVHGGNNVVHYSNIDGKDELVKLLNSFQPTYESRHAYAINFDPKEFGIEYGIRKMPTHFIIVKRLGYTSYNAGIWNGAELEDSCYDTYTAEQINEIKKTYSNPEDLINGVDVGFFIKQMYDNIETAINNCRKLNELNPSGAYGVIHLAKQYDKAEDYIGVNINCVPDDLLEIGDRIETREGNFKGKITALDAGNYNKYQDNIEVTWNDGEEVDTPYFACIFKYMGK